MVAGLFSTATPASAQFSLVDDYGDAPTGYGEPSHGLLNAELPLWMGDIVLGFDPDGGHQPSTGAVDDDCNTFEGSLVPVPVSCLPAPLSIVNDLLSDADNFILDDEDGVNIGQLVPNQVTPVSVEATAPGFLDAWIDFNFDGDFLDPIDQIFNNVPLGAGPNALSFTVPSVTDAGATYARFRFASTPVPGPSGAMGDGEVEDYAVVINQDFGDAPDDPNNANDYPTVIGSNGARHRLTDLRLGTIVDSEPNGISSPGALGDDLNPVAGPDDEEGVTLPNPWIQGETGQVVVRSSHGTVAQPKRLNAWADWNNDGDWADAGEQIFVDEPVVAGDNFRNVAVPNTAVVGSVVTRWRLSTQSGLSYTGLASDGEVEDHVFAVGSPGSNALDFGDAPNNDYHTLLGDNGARHAIGALALGDEIDGEPDGQPTNDAQGDDDNPAALPDDEDGVTFANATFVPGKTTQVTVESTGTGLLDAWLDADGDGEFDDIDEHVIDSEVVTACGDQTNTNPPQCLGRQEVDLHMPPGSYFGSTFARFRLSSGGTNAPEGFVPDGEVEDYEVDVVLECGATVTGDFELPFDMNCPGLGNSPNGLFIGDDKTDIDLNGFTISGDGVGNDRGISLAAGLVRADDVSIHDGEIVDFQRGIDITGHRAQLSNLVVDRNHGDGIRVDGNDTNVTSVSMRNNDGDGLDNAGHGLTVADTTVSQNLVAGIRNAGGNSVVRDSDILENGGTGVSIDGVNAFVTNNTITDNVGHGVDVIGERGRVNENIAISDNGGDGVRIEGQNFEVKLNPEIKSNGGDGIHAIGGNRIRVSRNLSNRNGDDGVDFEKAARGRVVKNKLGGGNRHWAIEAHAKVHGKGNKGQPCKPSSLC